MCVIVVNHDYDGGGCDDHSGGSYYVEGSCNDIVDNIGEVIIVVLGFVIANFFLTAPLASDNRVHYDAYRKQKGRKITGRKCCFSSFKLCVFGCSWCEVMWH